MMTFTEWLDQNKVNYPAGALDYLLNAIQDGATVDYLFDYCAASLSPLTRPDALRFLELKLDYETLQKQKQNAIEVLNEQNVSDAQLIKRIENAKRQTVLNDLVAPYRKRSQRLFEYLAHPPLVNWVDNLWNDMRGSQDLSTSEKWDSLSQLIDWSSPVKDFGQARLAVIEILADRLRRSMPCREMTRNELKDKGMIKVLPGKKFRPDGKFGKMVGQRSPLRDLMSPESASRYFSWNRGEEAAELELELTVRSPVLIEALEKELWGSSVKRRVSPELHDLFKDVVDLAYNQLIRDLKNEFFHEVAKMAEQETVRLAQSNLRKLLLAPPFGSKTVMGVIGEGKEFVFAAVDPSGLFIEKTSIELGPNPDPLSRAAVMAMVQKHAPHAFALANTPGARKIESWIREVLKEFTVTVPVYLVDEQGLQGYATGKVGEAELPKLRPLERAAVSIARRLQNPMQELIKIDPKMLGTGQYAEAINPTRLKYFLRMVVREVVHTLGIDINLASPASLKYLGGLSADEAKFLCQRVREKSAFLDRDQIMQLAELSDKAKTYAVPYLRIRDSRNPMDHTWVHPRFYSALESHGKTWKLSYPSDYVPQRIIDVISASQIPEKNEILIGLSRTYQDPRGNFVGFQFRDDLTRLKDLREGMSCHGRISNITTFGCFVDVGVSHDGLVHISELTQPLELYSVGDIVQVRVLGVDLAKQKASFSFRLDKTAPAPKAPHRNAEQRTERVAAVQASRNELKDHGSAQNKSRPKFHQVDGRKIVTDNPFAAAFENLNIGKNQK